MRIVDLIELKKKGGVLKKDEIEYTVDGYVKGIIPDYQMSALLMAIWFKGLSPDETADFTQAMAKSGEQLDLSAIDGIKVDKHSTGGVADSTTLILAPLVAACGVPVIKMSGRGLGHTGGTIDKLESVPGYNAGLGVANIIKNVKEHSLVITGQTGNLAPADKVIYALRDVTATVDCPSLIASSIMSKKIAVGADAIMLDVKVGSGAFMRDVPSARSLAEMMVTLGRSAGRKVRAVISNMSQPLGCSIGNSLEVIEAVDILKGDHKNSDLKKLAVELGAHMLVMAGKCENSEAGAKMLNNRIDDGSGYLKFREIIAAQGGNAAVIDDLSLMPHSNYRLDIKAEESGYISDINAMGIGKAAGILGAGRKKIDDIIDPSAGIVIRKRVGDAIDKDDALCTLHYNNENLAAEAADLAKKSIIYSKEPVERQKLIYDVIM